MTKYQEIENKLLQIEGGLFQNVCDAVIYYTEKDFPNIFRSGSQTGTLKVVKGTPDAFFVQHDERYTLVEYTTQAYGNKKQFLKKVKGDIDKCLNEAKTGISVEDIEKIIYCCTATVTIKELKELTDYCRGKGAKLEFKGIDSIARILAGRCVHVAKEFLGISIDTGQVLAPAVFANEYAASGLATPLTNTFMHREKEITQLVDAINSRSKVTIITGPPGVGKSKLAMEAFNRANATENHYQVYCITNKNTNIHDDLRTHLAEDRNYLILIDDANRQSDHLQSMLYLLNEKRTAKIHVMVTVRDYAYQDINSRCKDFLPETLIICGFEDAELKDILTGPDFNLNHQAVERVLHVADGNPRLAIMAAKVALDAKDINAISDVSDIYDRYFQNAIADGNVFSDQNVYKALGLLSFFFSINLEDIEFTDRLTQLFGIDKYLFKEALIKIEKLELAESTPDFSIIKISDQVMATYFFYKTFLKDEVLDFRIILQNYFESHLRRIKDSVVPANNTFTYQNVYPKIDPMLTQLWSSITTDEEKAFKFLELFWFYRHDDTFAFVADKINQINPPLVPEYVYDKSNNKSFKPQDRYLELISGFFTQPVPEIKTALELSFEYVAQVNDTYTQLIDALKSSFIFRYEDENYGHFRQLALWDFVIAGARKGEILFIKAFFELAHELMKPSFHVSSAGRKANTIQMYNFNLRLMEGVIKFRTMTWEFVQDNFKKYPGEIVDFLVHYLDRTPDKVKEVYECDFTFLLTLFDGQFTNTSFSHCYIVRDLVYWFRRVGIEHPRFNDLKEQFTNEAYRYYVLLSWDRLRDKYDYYYEYADFDKYNRIKEREIVLAFDLNSLDEFKHFYEVFLSIYNWKDNEVYQFNNSLNIVLGKAYINQLDEALMMVSHIMVKGNQSGIVPHAVFRHLWKSRSVPEKLFDEILEYSFKARASWILDFLAFAPKEHITAKYIGELIILFKTTTDSIYINPNTFDKIQLIKPDFLHEILSVIVERIEKDECRFLLDQHFFINKLQLIDNLPLIKKAYFQQDQIHQHFDYRFEGFLEILKLDSNFLLEYIEIIAMPFTGFHASDYQHFDIIWQLPNVYELVEEVLDYLVFQNYYSIKEDCANLFFQYLKPDQKLQPQQFLINYLLKNIQDIDKVNMVLNIARYSFKEQEDEFILQFLLANPDYDTFTKLELQNNFFMGSGNTIWADVKVLRWEQILTIFDNIKTKVYHYAKHKNYIKHWIAVEKRSGDAERKRVFMYGD